MKYVLLGIFSLFIGIASYLAEDLFFPIPNENSSSFAEGTLERAIDQDFKNLEKSNLLPNEVARVKMVYFLDHRSNPIQIDWKELSNQHFPQRSQGKFDFQIEAFDSDSKESNSSESEVIILQYSLFDSASKNKIWELSRSYPKVKSNSQK